MSASEMYDFLSAITPAYDYTLTLAAQGPIRIIGTANQVVQLGDDESEIIISLDDSSVFHVFYPFKALTESDAGTIFDLYHDTNKANKRANTFKWTHPTDGHTYVVRFDCDLEQVKYLTQIYGYGEICFKVKGRIND
ncbi:MAG: hypothetical protein ABIH23_04870 [bacterium]